MKHITRNFQVSVLAVLLLSAGAVCPAVAGPGEEEAPVMMMDSSAVVKVSVAPAEFRAQRGDTVRFEVVLEVDSKWHLYAHEDTVFYGIDLELPEDPPLDPVEVQYPRGEHGVFFGEEVQVLHGRQVVCVAGVVPCGLKAGKHSLELQMVVQACDDTRCLAPAFLPLAVKLDLEN